MFVTCGNSEFQMLHMLGTQCRIFRFISTEFDDDLRGVFASEEMRKDNVIHTRIVVRECVVNAMSNDNDDHVRIA